MTFLQLLILFIIFFLIYRAIKNLNRPTSGPRLNSNPEDLVKDPVCGVYLPRKEALALTVDGRVLYFCSEKCRRKFLNK